MISLGGYHDCIVYGSDDFKESPPSISHKRIDFIMNNITKWEIGRKYRHYDGWCFVVVKFEEKQEDTLICFNCGAKIDRDNLYAYDEKKKPAFKMDYPYRIFGKEICNECEWKYRPLPELNI